MTTHATQRDKHDPGGIRTHSPYNRERPQTHGLDNAATGIGRDCLIGGNNVYVALCIDFQERNHVDQRRPV
jgi:hypothetical protein